MRPTTVWSRRPLLQGRERDTRGNANNDWKRLTARPALGQLFTDALCDLRLDGDDNEVGTTSRDNVICRCVHTCRGQFVPVYLPRFGNGDVGFGDGVREEAANDGGGHVSATNEGEGTFL